MRVTDDVEPLSGPARERPLGWPVMAFLGVAAILLAAYVLSLGLVRPPGPDDSQYASEATRWLTGKPFTTLSGEPAVARPPAYVVLLAGATAVTGSWQSAEPLVAAIAVVVAFLAATTIAWSIGGAVAAILTVVVFTVPGVTDAFARSAIDGVQAALILAAIAVALVVGGRRGSWTSVSAVAVGIAIGLAILTKETALALAPWPLIWAAGQPANELRPALRWAAIATATLTLTILPWWLGVYEIAGTLFPTGIAAGTAVAGLIVLALGGLLPLLLVSDEINGRVAGWIGRLPERRRWWLAIVFAVVWALLIVVAFLLADARYALPRIPSQEETIEAIGRLLTLILLAPLSLAAGLIALALAGSRPMLRGLLLVGLLTAGIGAIVVVKGWDPRSALLPALALSLLLPVGTAVAVRWASRGASPGSRRARMAALSAIVIGVTSLNAVGLIQAARNPTPFTEAQTWDGAVVRDAASWLSSRLEPGESIVVSWLFASSLDAMTKSTYKIIESPTLQVRVGGPGEPVLVPIGTLFRENADLPTFAPDDWLFVRRHPQDRYLVALSARMLAETIESSGSRFLVLTGEHVVQSTATIAVDVLGWPGVREAARFSRDDAEIVILDIDRGTFAAGTFATQVNVTLLREWPVIVRAAARGVDPGTALCEVLAGRDIEIVPDEERGRALVARYLPTGCPPGAGLAP